MKTLVVLGASGVMGQRIVALVRRELPAVRVIAASRRGGQLRDLPLRAVDLADADELAALLGEADLVVNAVGPYDYPAAPLISACIAAGTHYADLAEVRSFLDEVREAARDGRAAERGLCIVPGCSTLPGLVQLLAGAWRERGDVARVDAWLSLGSRNPVAEGLLAGLLGPLGRPLSGGERCFAGTVVRRDAAGRRLRYGRYPAAGLEAGLDWGAQRVPLRFHVGFDRAWLSRALGLAAPLLARLPRASVPRVARLALPAAKLLRPLGTPRGSLVLEARGGDEELLATLEIAAERNGLDIPAAPPVWLAAGLAAGRVAARGCVGLDAAVELGEAVAWLRRAGHAVRGLA